MAAGEEKLEAFEGKDKKKYRARYRKRVKYRRVRGLQSGV
jgi:hypothetical protein